MAFSFDRFAGGVSRGFDEGVAASEQLDKARTRKEGRDYADYGKDLLEKTKMPAPGGNMKYNEAEYDPMSLDQTKAESITREGAPAQSAISNTAPQEGEHDPDSAVPVAKQAGKAVAAIKNGQAPEEAQQSAMSQAADESPPTVQDWDAYEQGMMARAIQMQRPDLFKGTSEMVAHLQHRGLTRNLDKAMAAAEMGNVQDQQKYLQKAYGFYANGKGMGTYVDKDGKVKGVYYDEDTKKPVGKPFEITMKTMQDRRMQATDFKTYYTAQVGERTAYTRARLAKQKETNAFADKQGVANAKYIDSMYDDENRPMEDEQPLPDREKTSQMMNRIQQINGRGATTDVAGGLAKRILQGTLPIPPTAPTYSDGTTGVRVGDKMIRVPLPPGYGKMADKGGNIVPAGDGSPGAKPPPRTPSPKGPVESTSALDQVMM